MTPQSSVVERWRRFWFDEIPPHSYALIRILIGVVGAMTIIGAWNPAFWQVDGIMPPAAASHSWPWLAAHGLGDIVGLGLRWAVLAGFVALALGIQTQFVAIGIFLGSAAMFWWNPAPFSGGQQLLHNITFPLVFVDSGAVWSVDALQRARRDREVPARPEPIWPLRLWQYQLALLYLAAGLWKMANPDWRSGLALHYVLNNPAYQRIPGVVPPALFGATVFLTYLTLAWELSFPVVVWFRRTTAGDAAHRPGASPWHVGDDGGRGFHADRADLVRGLPRSVANRGTRAATGFRRPRQLPASTSPSA